MQPYRANIVKNTKYTYLPTYSFEIKVPIIILIYNLHSVRNGFANFAHATSMLYSYVWII